MIIFSDGVDTRSWIESHAVLEIAKRTDLVVYAITIGQRQGEFLRSLSSVTGGRLIEIESVRDLTSLFTEILNEFRQRYLISYSPNGVDANGWHRVQVRTNNPRLIVRSRDGYLVETAGRK